MKPWLYVGTVSHARYGLAAHRFRYPALFLCFPLSRLDALGGPLFGVNRANLFSFHQRDHGDGQDALAWMRGILAEHGLAAADGEIWLQTQPRILGYVFNPVSFWYCHDRQNALRAVFCEVNNTFGERHGYLLHAPDFGPVHDGVTLTSRKVFHVSPFFPVDGEYRFRFLNRDDRRSVAIDYWREGRLTLKTAVTGLARPLDSRHLLGALASLGWSTVLVTARIHWQALHLWRKGAVFHRKPHPPTQEISS